MPAAFVDSNIIQGGRNTSDQYYDEAQPIMGAVDRGDLPRGRLLYCQLTEFLGPLQHKIGRENTIATYNALEEGSGWRIERAPSEILAHADQLWKRYNKPEYGDAVIAAYMLHEEIEYIYSLDDDFDEIEGVTRLDTPTNPFA